MTLALLMVIFAIEIGWLWAGDIFLRVVIWFFAEAPINLKKRRVA
jgi:hypothetical protein